MKITDIQELIKFVSKSGVSEVEIEDKDFKITIKTPPYKRGKGAVETIVQAAPMVAGHIPVQPMAQQIIPQQQVAAAPAPEAKKEVVDESSKYVEVKSPMIGTFYRRPSPDKPLFVNVGDTISTGDVICIVEAMKLFNEIESEVAGKIVKILVEDGSPIEYDQPLFLVDPA